MTHPQAALSNEIARIAARHWPGEYRMYHSQRYGVADDVIEGPLADPDLLATLPLVAELLDVAAAVFRKLSEGQIGCDGCGCCEAFALADSDVADVVGSMFARQSVWLVPIASRAMPS